MIQIDGVKHARPFHPMWELQYLNEMQKSP